MILNVNLQCWGNIAKGCRYGNAHKYFMLLQIFNIHTACRLAAGTQYNSNEVRDTTTMVSLIFLAHPKYLLRFFYFLPRLLRLVHSQTFINAPP